jgi:hypothetical protein
MNMRTLLTLLLPGLLLFSCDSLPVNYSVSRSWLMSEGKGIIPHTTRGTIKVIGVSVDRSGGWDSVEKEAAALAPLFFWERGYRTVGGDETADYAADIQAREREYNLGWHTRRSLAVEVRIWAAGDGESPGGADITQKLPLAAGRVVSIGDGSFSSSTTTGRMLSAAIRTATGKLSALRQGN